MSNITATLDLETISLNTDDFDDGRTVMIWTCSRMSSGAVVAFAETAGPQLDGLANDSLFHSGLRCGLQESVNEAMRIVPSLSCKWTEGLLSCSDSTR